MNTIEILEEHVSFSLFGLCRASGADPQQVQVLVAEGLLQPTGHEASWQFTGEALPLTRQALRLARDLELELTAVVLVMDLLAEIDRLRSRLATQ